MKSLRFLTACVLIFLSGLVIAEDLNETVTIRQDGDNTYYEYRLNGEISEIKVKPKVGPEYYLVPASDGTDDFIHRDNPEMRVPKWVILRW